MDPREDSIPHANFVIEWRVSSFSYRDIFRPIDRLFVKNMGLIGRKNSVG